MASTTKDRSIFTMFTGSSCRHDKDEYPVPKSSRDKAMPKPRKSLSAALTPSSWAAKLSVTSKIRCSGLTSQRCITSCTWSISWGCRNCALDKLTDINSGALCASTKRMRLRSAQACSNTNKPMALIRPQASATGIKLIGDTMPRSGCFQRTKASRPDTLRVFKSTTGWYTTYIWLRSKARRKSFSRATSSRTRRRMPGWNIT